MYNFARGAAALALIAAAALPAQAQEHGPDIVETANAAGSFNTLAAALDAAGLVETLQGEGPFTVFAPTDDAFAALPEGTVESLLQPENRDALISILTYHVVAGRVAAEQVVELDEATTVNGADVRIRVDGDGVRVNDANVVTTDVFASNGVIHVIDAVLLPPELMSTDRASAPMSERRVRAAAEILSLAIERGVGIEPPPNAPIRVLDTRKFSHVPYFRELLTTEEQDAYRDAVWHLRDDEERDQFVADHIRRMRERAVARGLTYPGLNKYEQGAVDRAGIDVSRIGMDGRIIAEADTRAPQR